MTDMPFIRWNLEAILEHHNLTKYQLAQAMANERANANSRLTQLYRMKTPSNLNLQTLADIITGLERLTDKRFTAADLMTYQREQPELFDSTSGGAA